MMVNQNESTLTLLLFPGTYSIFVYTAVTSIFPNSSLRVSRLYLVVAILHEKILIAFLPNMNRLLKYIFTKSR